MVGQFRGADHSMAGHIRGGVHFVQEESFARERCERAAHETKLVISEWTIRCQPSAITNSSSLNGSEIDAGGSIIMPMDISTLETTMSITRNGTMMRKPI